MEKGSLFFVLYDDVEAIELDRKKIVDIVKSIAYALYYLHHDCTPLIVHRDVTTIMSYSSQSGTQLFLTLA